MITLPPRRLRVDLYAIACIVIGGLLFATAATMLGVLLGR